MKHLKSAGIFMIILGVAVCAIGVGVNAATAYEHYQGFADHGYYASFLHYFWTVGKANALVSVICGCVPAIAGIILLKRK